MNAYARGTDLSVSLTAALARVPECLADARARRSLLAIGRMLPGILASGPMGLELRLAGPSTVDFFAAAIPGTPGFAALISALHNPPPAHPWANPQQALDLATVLARWQRREGMLPCVARYLLVEVDAPATADDLVAVPGIFLAPREARDVPRAGQLPNVFHRFIDATTSATAELSGVWPDPATAQQLATIVKALPGEADIFAVGAMVSRAAGSSMRIAIRRLGAAGMDDLLQAMGRTRQAAMLHEFIHITPADRRVLHFEIGPGAEQRVGLELLPSRDWQQASAAGWPELLDDLVARGVADADRAAVVTALIDAEGDPLWGLAHVKVAADASGVLPVAKLYVGLLQRNQAATGTGGTDEMA